MGQPTFMDKVTGMGECFDDIVANLRPQTMRDLHKVIHHLYGHYFNMVAHKGGYYCELTLELTLDRFKQAYAAAVEETADPDPTEDEETPAWCTQPLVNDVDYLWLVFTALTNVWSNFFDEVNGDFEDTDGEVYEEPEQYKYDDCLTGNIVREHTDGWPDDCFDNKLVSAEADKLVIRLSGEVDNSKFEDEDEDEFEDEDEDGEDNEPIVESPVTTIILHGNGRLTMTTNPLAQRANQPVKRGGPLSNATDDMFVVI